MFDDVDECLDGGVGDNGSADTVMLSDIEDVKAIVRMNV
jgi:hypothetical protein